MSFSKLLLYRDITLKQCVNNIVKKKYAIYLNYLLYNFLNFNILSYLHVYFV